MTSTLPPQVQEAFDRFITTEYTTVGSGGQPITWPVTPYYRPGDATIDVTTGLGYPKKAQDARRHPAVSLLFSEPKGSGVESGIQVLVQGTADVDDRDLDANRERYWRESAEKLPATKGMHPPKLVRGLFKWYYTRLYVRVRPERIFVWPGGDLSAEPVIHDSRQEEVRSGHAEEELEPLEPPPGGDTPWDERIRELGDRYETAVLAWPAPDGFPLSARVPISLDEANRRVRLQAVPEGLPVAEGKACITAHSHAPDFTWQENFQVRGTLTQGEDGSWTLQPRKLVGGFELPDEGQLGVMRRNFKKARRFRRIAKRQLRERAERES